MSQPQGPSGQPNIVASSMISAFFTSITNYPFVRIKNILQTQSVNPSFSNRGKMQGAIDCIGRIWREEGAFSYWRGAIPGIAHAVFHRYLHFMGIYLTETMDKQDLKEYHADKFPMLFFAVSTYALLYPLQVAQVRLACDYGLEASRRYLGMNHTLKEAFKSEGFKGVYRGFIPGIANALLFQPIFFTGARFLAKPRKDGPENPGQSQFKMRTWAVVVKAMIYPLEVLRNKMIMYTGNDHFQFKGMLNVVQSTFEQEGIKGFYRGFQVDLALFIPGILLAGYLAQKHSPY